MSSNISQLRVLSVIPGGQGNASMIFAKRQAQSLLNEGVVNRNFMLASRTSLPALWSELRRFRREIREFQPHLVHAHFGTVTGLFCTVATRLPVVVTFRGSDLNPCPSMPWLRSALGKMFSQLAALRARHVICVSRQLRNRLWWRRRRISVIPTGVDTDAFFPQSREVTRHKLGWSSDDAIVLFNAGQTPAVKRLDLAQAAVESARKQVPNIRLVVLDGSIDPQKVPLLMNAPDCLLLTSDWEGSPTVVQEALACNLPVVSVEVGDVSDRLRDVRPSAIAARTAAALGQALVAMIREPRRSNGREFAADISLRALAPKLISIYRDAIGWPAAGRKPAEGNKSESHARPTSAGALVSSSFFQG